METQLHLCRCLHCCEENKETSIPLTDKPVLEKSGIRESTRRDNMTDLRKISLTFAQMLVGCCSGILAGGILLFLINLMWQGLQGAHLGGFLTALLLLISFLIVFGSVVAATAEGVRQMGRFIPRQTSRRRIYEGSFLGTCAAVALLTVTRADWVTTLQELGAPIRLLGTLVYYSIVLPVRFVIYWFPPLLLLIIAAPIGAAIGYNLSPPEVEGPKTEDSGEQPAAAKGGKKKT